MSNIFVLLGKCNSLKLNHLCRNMAINIGGMRMKYKDKSETFLENDINIKEPFSQFKVWFEEVLKNPEVIEPTAMCLATATKSGIPSARFVLLKEFSKSGFKFFTNYDSRKGKEMEENPFVALTFYWQLFNRSVRIEGRVEKLELSEADEYFSKRPKPSQIGACASKQSSVIKGRSVLEENEKRLSELYKDTSVPRPDSWGGYIVIPESVEFWQGQTDRLHDRIKFRKLLPGEKIDEVLVHKGEDDWVYERLSP